MYIVKWGVKIFLLVYYLRIVLLGRVPRYLVKSHKLHLAPRVGFEPTTFRLTAERSTIELPGNVESRNV